MKKQSIRRFLALTTAVVGAFALATPQAAAAEVGWKAVSTTPAWECFPTGYEQHKGSANVFFKICAVTNSSGGAQAVLVVQNKASVAIAIEGENQTNFGGDVDCAPSTLQPGYTRGCYGPTKTASGRLVVSGRLNFNGIDDWI
ncbi:hypothetical protein ACF08N_27905 [Streptomyces sp. NPDC015127]|uniref:hypothetical protein n=1 Tax=Streptomyces sp. NPDC015127 TaxID=3364939 RepID=UPI003701E414